MRADFVQVDASAEIPVREAGTGPGAVRGVVIRGVNVRSGPGQDFESLGLLNEEDVVTILGRDSSGLWMQIEFPGSANGMGWVAADFLQVDDPNALPVVGEATEAGGMEAPVTPLEHAMAIPVATAYPDGDTADAPLASVALRPGDVQAVQIQGEVSAPGGDTEDWLAFSAQAVEVIMQVGCEQGALEVMLMRAGEVIESFVPACNSEFMITVTPGETYQLRLSASSGDNVYVRYSLKIRILR